MNLAKKGTIVSVKQIAKRTIEVAIKVPEDFNFIAGQYIWLMVPELKYPDPRGNTRMFSVASPPNRKGELELNNISKKIADTLDKIEEYSSKDIEKLK